MLSFSRSTVGVSSNGARPRRCRDLRCPRRTLSPPRSPRGPPQPQRPKSSFNPWPRAAWDFVVLGQATTLTSWPTSLQPACRRPDSSARSHLPAPRGGCAAGCPGYVVRVGHEQRVADAMAGALRRGEVATLNGASAGFRGPPATNQRCDRGVGRQPSTLPWRAFVCPVTPGAQCWAAGCPGRCTPAAPRGGLPPRHPPAFRLRMSASHEPLQHAKNEERGLPQGHHRVPENIRREAVLL